MEMGRGGEGVGGKERTTHNTQHPPVEEAACVERATRTETAWKRRSSSSRDQKRRRTRTRTERPHKGAWLSSLAWGGDATPQEENADLPGFHPERMHLLLKGV